MYGKLCSALRTVTRSGVQHTKRTIASTKLIIVSAGLVTTSFVPLVAISGTAHADVNCNPNGTNLSGSSWLGGGGVNICNNGSSSTDDYGASCVSVSGAPGGSGCSAGSVYAAEEWQCVELVNRLYLTKGWTNTTLWGNGNTIVNDVSNHGGLTKQSNGSVSYVNTGDVITLDDGGFGHAGIINSIDGNGTIHIKNQNALLDSSAYIDSGSLSNGNAHYHMNAWAPYTFQAIVHHPTASPPPPTSPVPWNFETLDGDPSSVGQYNADVGQNTRSIVYNNNLQVFYYDKTNGRLRHAWKQGTGSWTFEVLDGLGGANGRTTDNVGSAISVTTYNSTLQLFYYDSTAHTLRHAWSDANGWHFETLDTSGDVGSASTTLTYGTSLQLYYPNLSNGDLRHAWSDANGWHFENLDGDGGSVAGGQGKAVSQVGSSLTSTLDSNGNLQLFYYAYGSSGKTLRHAWADANGWHFENLDGGNLGSNSGSTDDIGQNPSTVLNGSTLQLFSYNASKGDLRHDWSDANGWHWENLDGQGSNGPDQYTLGLYSSTVMSGSTLQLFYYDNYWGEMRHAWSDTGGWHFENLDGLGGLPSGRLGPWVSVGLYPSAIIYNNVPQVFYYDATNGNLRHTWSQ
jgi:hypothetical protein